VCIYRGAHNWYAGTQRKREDNQQCVMPLVLLRAFAYLTDLLLILSTQQHAISVSTCRVNTSRLSVSHAAELRCRRVRAHRDGAKKKVTCTINYIYPLTNRTLPTCTTFSEVLKFRAHWEHPPTTQHFLCVFCKLHGAFAKGTTSTPACITSPPFN